MTEKEEFLEGGNLCFCAQEQLLSYSKDIRQVRHRGMASPVPNRQMYECRKIVMVRLLPSLGGDMCVIPQV